MSYNRNIKSDEKALCFLLDDLEGRECIMMISTKGRYALRVLIDMAEHQSGGYIPLKAIAKRQGISEKYLESIVKTLRPAHRRSHPAPDGRNACPGRLP